MHRLSLLAVLLVLSGCATASVYRDVAPAPPPEGEVAHTILIAGGLDRLRDTAALTALASDARAAGETSTVVLIGLAPAPGRPDAVPELVQALAGYTGRLVVVPGVHDQAGGRGALRDRVDRLSAELRANVSLPVGDGARLDEIDIGETLRLVTLDTAWWLSPSPADDATRSDVADRLDQLVDDRDDEQLVIVGAHPLYSNGDAGGYATVLGGAATLGVGPLLAQTVGLSGQDLAAPTYRRMRDAFLGAFGEHERLTYAGALDGSLQAFQRGINAGRERQTFLVSGSAGGTTEPVVAGRHARLAAPRAGYWRLRYHTDGRLVAEAVAPGAVLWADEVSPPDPELVPDRIPDDIAPAASRPETVTRPSDAAFREGRIETSAVARALAGDTYRDAWRAEVTVPVLDLDTFAGGLTPVRRGGGNQTTKLRLSGADGFDYDLRLIEKGGSGGVPPELADGAAGDLVRDLRSSVIPYGAAVATELTWAAGLRSPRPAVVAVPDSPRLGRYRDEFAGRLGLLEVQPDDDMSAFPGWEGVTDVISSQKLREELRDDQDYTVDQASYLRARLVDLLIADWDRHAGQWRWAAYEPGDLDPSLRGRAARAGKVFVAIPGDRDWAFYNPGGIAQRVLFFANRRHQPFGESYGSLTGLSNSGRFQDRRFLNALPADSVQAIARGLRDALSDEVIDRALALLPPNVAAEVGEDWRRALRARRDRLPQVAERLYEFVSRDVDVVGSDERDWFVARAAPGGLTVEVYGDDDGARGRRLYRRTFRASETREVRLFGLGGDDRFDLRGAGSGIRLRVIGGADADQISGDRAVQVYDTPGGAQVSGGARSVLRTTPDVGLYDEHAPYRSLRIVAPVLGANATDGLVLGAAVTTTTQGFRLRPFAARHTVSADVATETGGLRATYAGRFTRRTGPGLAVDLLAASPRVARNFYGLGNGTPEAPDDSEELSVARLEATARLVTGTGAGLSVSAGPTLRYADPSRDDEREVGPLATLPDDAFGAQTHAGATARLDLTTADAVVNPRQGARVGAFATGLVGASGPAEAYGALGADLALYVPVRLRPQITLALRGGAEHRLGTPPFTTPRRSVRAAGCADSGPNALPAPRPPRRRPSSARSSCASIPTSRRSTSACSRSSMAAASGRATARSRARPGSPRRTIKASTSARAAGSGWACWTAPCSPPPSSAPTKTFWLASGSGSTSSASRR